MSATWLSDDERRPEKSPYVTELENPAERVHQIQQILITLPRVVIVVMRYLFAFLNQ